jgi:hypothetical protein
MRVSAAKLRSRLRPLGLDLLPIDGQASSHAVWVDLGHIDCGAGEALGVDQHTWWQRTAAISGSPLGAAVSAWLGGVAKSLSHGVSRTLGTYSELIVGAPNVIAAGGNGRPYAFVLGMLTDSRIAIWGDRALGYGYGKQLCRVAGTRFDSYAATAVDGSALLEAEITPAHAHEWQSVPALPGFRRMLPLLSQPLLGHLAMDRFAVSWLERDYDSAELVPANVRLRWGATLARGLAAGELVVPPVRKQAAAAAAFSARRIPTRVTYPRHLRLAEL